MMENTRPLFLLEEQLTYKLRGIFIEVSREHGYLFKEKFYQKILIEKFTQHEVDFISHPKIPIYNIKTGKIVENYYPDFIVKNKIIVEVKAQGQIFNNHINQLIRYLNSTKYEIGLIVNFGTPRVQIERKIFTNDRKLFCTYNTLIAH